MVKKLCAVVLGMAMAISAGCAAAPNPDGGETPGGNETQTEVNWKIIKRPGHWKKTMFICGTGTGCAVKNV